MNTKIFCLACLFALLTSSGFIASAAGEPESATQRQAAGAALPERSDSAGTAKVPPELLARLQGLQVARRKAREDALKDAKSWVEQRPQRAAQHRQEIAQVWGDLAGTIDAQARLRVHADRMARLNRILDLALQKSDSALKARVEADMQRELARHAQAMQTVRALAGLE